MIRQVPVGKGNQNLITLMLMDTGIFTELHNVYSTVMTLIKLNENLVSIYKFYP